MYSDVLIPNLDTENLHHVTVFMKTVMVSFYIYICLKTKHHLENVGKIRVYTECL
jgi:hypothetical protein